MGQIKNTQVLDLVTKLCTTLSQEKINYCHWKSNAALDRSASGKNDLDLLVDRADSQAFLEILYRLGFREASSPEDLMIPAVHNYYGYDTSADVFVNVHAHFLLIIGHDLTKNYHIPIEHLYLDSSKQNGVFRVPASEYEFILFVVRMVIKHFTWDSLLLRHEKLSSSEIKEFNYLLEHTTELEMDEVLSKHFNFIDRSAFQACNQMLQSSASVARRIWMGQKLIASLSPYSRESQFVDAGLKFFRRFAWSIKRRIFHQEYRKKMHKGGLIAAIVGGDGAGKTTVVKGICDWLGVDFAVRRFHMGKPGWSLLTLFIRGLLKIGRLFGFFPFQRAEIQYTNDPALLIFPGYPWMIREICTARDRYLTYKKALYYATKGGFVILDRFPLQQIKFMDGPQIARMTTGVPRNRFINWLIDLEGGYYQKITPPDMLIVLRVDPRIAVQRKTDEIEINVKSRATEIWEIDWSQTSGFIIDANRSSEAVLTEVKELIWSWL